MRTFKVISRTRSNFSVITSIWVKPLEEPGEYEQSVEKSAFLARKIKCLIS